MTLYCQINFFSQLFVIPPSISWCVKFTAKFLLTLWLASYIACYPFYFLNANTNTHYPWVHDHTVTNQAVSCYNGNITVRPLSMVTERWQQQPDINLIGDIFQIIVMILGAFILFYAIFQRLLQYICSKPTFKLVCTYLPFLIIISKCVRGLFADILFKG